MNTQVYTALFMLFLFHSTYTRAATRAPIPHTIQHQIAVKSALRLYLPEPLIDIIHMYAYEASTPWLRNASLSTWYNTCYYIHEIDVSSSMPKMNTIMIRPLPNPVVLFHNRSPYYNQTDQECIKKKYASRFSGACSIKILPPQNSKGDDLLRKLSAVDHAILCALHIAFMNKQPISLKIETNNYIVTEISVRNGFASLATHIEQIYNRLKAAIRTPEFLQLDPHPSQALVHEFLKACEVSRCVEQLKKVDAEKVDQFIF